MQRAGEMGWEDPGKKYLGKHCENTIQEIVTLPFATSKENSF